MNSTEDKTIERLDKFFTKYVDDLENISIKDEFEYLKKAYVKLNKRYKKIIKQGDSEQHRSLKVQEKSSDNISRLKSHVIASVSKNRVEKIKIKENTASEYNNIIDELKLRILELDSSNLKSRNILNKYFKENKELLAIIDKKGYNFDLILEKEIAKADMKQYSFSLIAIKLENLDDIQKRQANIGFINNIISSLERFFIRTIKKFDIVHYEGNGLFYIIYFENKKHKVSDVVSKIGANKEISNIKLEFQIGISHTSDGKNKQRLMNEAILDLE